MANSTNIIILPLIFLLCFVFPPTATSSSNQTDFLSLLAFKSALNDPLGALTSWNRTTHFCSWNGIQCGRRHRDRVVAINLTSRGLVGPLSPHVGNLSFLRTIVLQNNSFHGQIPQEINLLTRLELVDFSSIPFVGEIPKNLSRYSCPNLVYLNLTGNKLSGAIPTELGSLSKLEVLALSANTLSGPIPPSIGNSTSLRELHLKSCGLSGEIPESLAQLQSLTFLLLSNNSLTGAIPSALFNISAIQYFEVNINQLHGAIPSTIGLTLANLKYIYLWQNQFGGPIPASLSNASQLERVDMAENYFTGPMPQLGRLTQLEELVLYRNPIGDDINFISSLTNSTTLKYLEVSDSLLFGSLPDSTANLSGHLYWLSLLRNKIHGKIPSGIGNLIGLAEVDLSDNYLEGPLPLAIGKLSHLRDLYLERNGFSDKLPFSLGNLTFLSRLFLNGNNFAGNLPSSLCNCTNLLQLDLSSNNFNGFIPQEIMKLSSLSVRFNLSHNAFEGSIPYEVGSLTNLIGLDLSSNRLSGPIPNSLSRCTSLEKIYLDGNLLQGEIPPELSALKSLQVLDLSRNNLSGPIPEFLGKLTLGRLNLSFNRLHGEVPVAGVFKNRTSISVEGNRGLCGGIPELKLPSCSLAKSPKKNLATLLKILIPISVAGGICLVLLVFLSYKQRVAQRNQISSASSSFDIQFMRLSYADLLRATGGFSEGNLIGVGRFGSVYKGILEDGQTLVAVKVLNLAVRGASRSFVAECNALRGVRHRNLVRILSVCESIDFQGNDFKALIYEYKANISLEKWLYNSSEQEEGCGEIRNLSMIQRLNIAIDIAQAIEYPHFGTDSSIVHGDLKPSNILLDHEMTACVGDFGLATIISNIVPSHESSSSSGIKGTLGYVAPEYATNNLISTQGDTYSYGILLLEMFTDKRPTDEAFKDHVNLHSFVSNALPDHVTEIVGPRFAMGEDMTRKVRDCVASTLSIGVACSRTVPRDRMLITDVVKELRKIRAYYLVQESN